MINDINDLKLFTRIVAAGSLSETARRVNSSLPAISRRLTAMEARLGARLVDRSTRRFALTEEGSLLYERGLVILGELEELEAHVGARTALPFGHIRVGAPNEIGRLRFAPMVAEFSKLYPHVTVELVLGDSRLDPMTDELDVVLHIDKPQDSNIVVLKLLSSRLVLCASPGYLAARGTPERPADLLDHSCLPLVRGRYVFNEWTFMDDGVKQEIRVGGPLSSNSAEVIHGWALAGWGIALKALWDVDEDLRAGRLIEILPRHSLNEVNLYATYPTKSHLPRRVRVFIDHMLQGLTRTAPSSGTPSER